MWVIVCLVTDDDCSLKSYHRHVGVGVVGSHVGETRDQE